MVFKAVLLGISSSTPTKDRNPTSLAIKYNENTFLFDAPEGVQQQIMRSKLSYMDIKHIFLSHFHADHTLGLAGLIATMSLHNRTEPLNIFGPKGVKSKVLTMFDIFEIVPKFEIETIELKEGIVFETKDFSIEAIKVKHSIECFGFVFKEKDKKGKFNREKAEALGIPPGPLYSELQKGKTIKVNGKIIKPEDVIDFNFIKKGKSIGYFVDAYGTEHGFALKNIDLVFHEATFLSKDKEQAKKTKHSVVSEVAKMLALEKAKKWVLINFSTRYKDLKPLLYEAQQFFPNSEIGIELKEYILKR